ncbi:MAG TPA: hypothetical protein VFJ16_28870 [Longimicrobium sp.]|nr:hypothetical protein [Longimicrobium sp.]
MNGFAVLNVVIGLFFVYLLLSMICSAVNEYISAMLNKRGKVLIAGITKLLNDTGAGDRTAALLAHPLIRSLYGKGGRRPSYIPARNFAIALLDVARSGAPATDLTGVLDLFEKDSVFDVTRFLADPAITAALGNPAIPDTVRVKMLGALAGAQTDYQKLQDSVEVWFNQSMDRVSGTYKRYTQIALLIIGAVVTLAINADTIQIWQRLAASPRLQEVIVAQAVQAIPSIQQELQRQGQLPAPPADGTTSPQSPSAPNDSAAKAAIDTAQARLARTQLGLGWSRAELARLGLVSGKSADPWAVLEKIVGLILTIIALSFGAPFWFDMLNKLVNIRGAGRAPDENPRKPAAAGKRPAEQAPA